MFCFWLCSYITWQYSTSYPHIRIFTMLTLFSVWVRTTWTHRDLTPDTVQTCQALVALDTSMTAVTLGGRVTLHPDMLHSLEGSRDINVNVLAFRSLILLLRNFCGIRGVKVSSCPITTQEATEDVPVSKWECDLTDHPVIFSAFPDKGGEKPTNRTACFACVVSHSRQCAGVILHTCWCRRRCLWTHTFRARCTCILEERQQTSALVFLTS